MNNWVPPAVAVKKSADEVTIDTCNVTRVRIILDVLSMYMPQSDLQQDLQEQVTKLLVEMEQESNND